MQVHASGKSNRALCKYLMDYKLDYLIKVVVVKPCKYTSSKSNEAMCKYLMDYKLNYTPGNLKVVTCVMMRFNSPKTYPWLELNKQQTILHVLSLVVTYYVR